MVLLSNMTERAFSLPRLLSAIVSNCLAGYLCLGAACLCNPAFPSASGRALVATSSSEFTAVRSTVTNILPLHFVAWQLVGLASGFLIVRWLMCRMALWCVWITGLLLAICGLLTGAATGTVPQICVLGIAAAFLWQSGEQAVFATTPNFRRWSVMGWMITAFSASVCLLAGVEWLQLSAAIPPASFISAMCAALIVAVGLLFREATSVRLVNTAQLAMHPTSETGCCEQTKTDDHDHVAENLESCGSQECCGGLQACSTSLWIGIVLSACGWLLLFGTLNGLLHFENAPSLPWLLGFGLSTIIVLQGYRILMQQTGNTLALPMFLMTELLLAVICFATGPGAFHNLFSALLTGVTFACFYGCLNQIPEYFQDTQQSWNRTLSLSLGGLLAASIVFVLSSLPSESHGTLLTLVIPTVTIFASIIAMRSIRQPMLVTRFAERFLAQKTG